MQSHKDARLSYNSELNSLYLKIAFPFCLSLADNVFNPCTVGELFSIH